MEYKLTKDVYMSLNALTIKNFQSSVIKKGTGCLPNGEIQQLDIASNFQLCNSVTQKKQSSSRQGKISNSYKQETKNQQFQTIILENSKLNNKVLELEKINKQRTQQNYQMKRIIENQKVQLQNLKKQTNIQQKKPEQQDENLQKIENLQKQIQQLQQKRISSKKLKTQSLKNTYYQNQQSDLQSQNKCQTKPKLQSETEITSKSLILGIIKQLHQIYLKLPQSNDHILQQINKSNQAIFVQVVQNKIKLNQLLNL